MNDLQEMAEQSRLSRLLEGHPLLRAKVEELKSQDDARRRERIAELKAQIAEIDRDTSSVVTRVQFANAEIDSLTARYHQELRKLSAHRDEIQSAHHQLIGRRREAYHEIQRLEGTRHDGPLITWEKKAPDWFEEQVAQQKQQLASFAFAPPRGKPVVTYVGNEIVAITK